MLDVVDDAGNTVVVPVVFNAHGRNAEINLATTAYGKENKLWFATQSQNDAVVYANSKKMRRWNTSSGSNSLRGSNASGRSVLLNQQANTSCSTPAKKAASFEVAYFLM